MSSGAKVGWRRRSARRSSAGATFSSSTLILKQIVSFPVKASKLPPMESASRANCWAEREVVPLKSMCSTKWEMPFRSSDWPREPEAIQTPMETERIWGIDSVRTSRPLGRRVRRMLRAGDGVAGKKGGGLVMRVLVNSCVTKSGWRVDVWAVGMGGIPGRFLRQAQDRLFDCGHDAAFAQDDSLWAAMRNPTSVAVELRLTWGTREIRYGDSDSTSQNDESKTLGQLYGDEFYAYTFAEVAGVLAVGCVVPVLVDAEAGERLAGFGGIVNGAGGRLVGQRLLVEVVVDRAGDDGSEGGLVAQEVEGDRVEGAAVLRGEQAGGPVIVEGGALPLADGGEAELVVLGGVEAVDEVEDGFAAGLRVDVHVDQAVVGGHALRGGSADAVAAFDGEERMDVARAG